MPDHPRQRDLCRARVVCRGNIAQDVEDRPYRVEVLREEQGIHRPDPRRRAMLAGVAT